MPRHVASCPKSSIHTNTTVPCTPLSPCAAAAAAAAPPPPAAAAAAAPPPPPSLAPSLALPSSALWPVLLPLRDEASVESGTAKGPLVQAVSELLESGSLLGDLFETTCGGGSAELYDLVGLRTEASATRQPIHSDTPWQKVPGLFCAFIALQDVRYEMGTTVFLPGTHKQTKARKSFDDGQFDGRRDAMLAKAPSRYSMLRAGMHAPCARGGLASVAGVKLHPGFALDARGGDPDRTISMFASPELMQTR